MDGERSIEFTSTSNTVENRDGLVPGDGGSGGLPTFPGSRFELTTLNNGAVFLSNVSAPPSSYIRSGSNAP